MGDEGDDIGMTLDQIIKAHGEESCGEPTCKVEAAREFIKKARRLKNPWSEVLALHVHSSILAQTLIGHSEETESLRRRFGLFLFYLCERLGGIVFTPSFGAIGTMPGQIKIEDMDDGTHILTIMPESEERRKRLH